MLDQRTDDLPVVGQTVSLQRLTYATIVMMLLLVVYDGGDDMASFAGAAVVILVPTLALSLAHLSSEAVNAHAARARPLTLAEWRQISTNELQILVTALPPLLVLAVGWLSALDAASTINVVLCTGVVTLTGLAAIAARRAGFRGWRLVIMAISGGAVGLFVVSLQFLLEPH